MKIKTAGRLLDFSMALGVFLLGALTGLVSTYFLIPLIAYFITIGILICRLRCPRCGRPVHLKKLKNAFGPYDEYWSPFMAKQCFQCSYDLRYAQFKWKMFSKHWKPSEVGKKDKS